MNDRAQLIKSMMLAHRQTLARPASTVTCTCHDWKPSIPEPPDTDEIFNEAKIQFMLTAMDEHMTHQAEVIELVLRLEDIGEIEETHADQEKPKWRDSPSPS